MSKFLRRLVIEYVTACLLFAVYFAIIVIFTDLGGSTRSAVNGLAKFMAMLSVPVISVRCLLAYCEGVGLRIGSLWHWVIRIGMWLPVAYVFSGVYLSAGCERDNGLFLAVTGSLATGAGGMIERWLWRKKEWPNQALQHNDRDCHGGCVRTRRASHGRG